MSEQNKRFNTQVLKRALSYLRPYRWNFIWALLTTLLAAFIAPFRVLIIAKMVEAFIAGGHNILVDFTPDEFADSRESAFLFWTLIIVVTLVVEGFIQFARTYLSNWLGQAIIRDLRVRLFRRISHFKLKYYDNTPIGALVTRVISDIEAISDIFSQGILTISADILTVLTVVVLMIRESWELALLCLIPLPLMLFAARVFAKAMKKAYQAERLQVNKLNTFVQEHLTGMNIVQIFNREAREMDKFDGINKAHRKAHIDAVWAFSIFLPFVELMSALAVAIMITWAVASFQPEHNPEAWFGRVFGFILWISMLFRPIRQLADRFNTLQRGVVRAERVFKVLDEDANIKNDGTLVVDRIKGGLEFKNVHFAYNEPEYVINGIDFKVEEGETVAFVGATGAGKSTIVNLVSRFYEFQKGQILVDGVDIREYDLNCLRAHIALVPQNVFLFSDTVHNNITLKNENISREQVIAAAKEVQAHDFIMRLPGDYDFNVRERGGMLSVGQRQLLSFIRAYVYNPSVLILDEATSSIDTESEELIQAATEKITKGRTSVIIAHRLSTIQNADRIYVMEKGRIIESGTHVQLLEQKGHYSKLYELQFS